MKSARQLKAHISNLSGKTGVKAEVLHRCYMMERFLKRLSLSQYKHHFILKGGLLIAYIVGLESRNTIDLDSTVRGYPLTSGSLREMIESIAAIPVDDTIEFNITKIEPIMEERDYECFRVKMIADFEGMKIPVKLDISTGDAITPQPIEFTRKLMFSDEQIEILAYNLETVLAEKLEAIIKLNLAGTRMRDYYDVYILARLHKDDIDYKLLKTAFSATTKHRNPGSTLWNITDIKGDIKESKVLQGLWREYSANYDYAEQLSWSEVCEALDDIFERMR